MAKKDPDLFDKLRANGLRKRAASNLSKAFGRADKTPPGKGARKAVTQLRSVVEGLRPADRARGGPAKRKAAAKKAAAARKRKANERSRAAKKAAQTRSRSTRSRRTARSK